MAETNTKSSSKDKRLKHCREWLVTTLLTQTDGRTLASAGLLAGEIPLLVIVGSWIVVALFMSKGTIPERVTMILGAIVPWLPFLAISVLLSPAAAWLARWGERVYRRGRLAATIAFMPVMPMIFGVFLTPSLITIAPLLGVMSIWLIGEIWWQLFLLFLQRLATFDYWSKLDEESQPQGGDSLYEYRSFLETKKTALIERKLRWEDMAQADHTDLDGSSGPNSNPHPTWGTSNPQEKASPTGSLAFLGQQWTRPWAIALVITCLLGGLALWRLGSRITPPKEAITSQPPSIVFWYQVSEPEAALLDDLIQAYNALSSSEGNTSLVQGYNQAGDFPLQIYRSQITGEAPDILLVHKESADQLQVTKVFPLWPDHLWRQRLTLVVTPTTKLAKEAETFASYLQDKLNSY
jgi:hypothetical protein